MEQDKSTRGQKNAGMHARVRDGIGDSIGTDVTALGVVAWESLGPA